MPFLMENIFILGIFIKPMTDCISSLEIENILHLRYEKKTYFSSKLRFFHMIFMKAGPGVTYSNQYCDQHFNQFWVYLIQEGYVKTFKYLQNHIFFEQNLCGRPSCTTSTNKDNVHNYPLRKTANLSLNIFIRKN